jgi:hypothetical protein
MKTFLIWAVIVVAGIELGGIAFDSMKRQIENDMDKMHELHQQKLEEAIDGQ